MGTWPIDPPAKIGQKASFERGNPPETVTVTRTGGDRMKVTYSGPGARERHYTVLLTATRQPDEYEVEVRSHSLGGTYISQWSDLGSQL